jgi:serine/threonine-protein kinase
MADETTAKHWWQGLAGVVTAVAALLTAVGGMLAILFQYGVLGGADAPEDASGSGASTSSAAGPDSPTSAPAGKPWSEVAAVFTAQDGTRTTVRAATVRYCISAGAGLVLSTGQDVAFEKMRSVEVLRSDEQFAPEGKADVVITLVGGQQVRGGIGSGCDLFGFNDAGRYSLYPQKLKRIDFKWS